MHDVFRVDKKGNPTSAKVLRGYELLRNHGVETNILCTVNAANQDHPLDASTGTSGTISERRSSS